MTIRRFSAGRYGPTPAAFTLIEAVAALALTVIAGAALLLGVGSSLQTTNDTLKRAIADGMAEQLLDEVAGARYMEYGCNPYDAYLQPGGAEAETGTRERFDDIDDYNGFRSQPPVDSWGVPLGEDDGEGAQRHPGFRAPEGFFDRWQEEIDVFYVSESDLTTRLPPGQVSDYRAIRVRVFYVHPDGGSRPLAELRRVVAYVPPL